MTFTVPTGRTPLRPARGPFAALKAAESELKEGELVYAEDLKGLFVLTDPGTTGGSSGMPRELVAVSNGQVVPPMPMRIVMVDDPSVAGKAPLAPRDGDLAIAAKVAANAQMAADWGVVAGTPVTSGDVFLYVNDWAFIGNLGAAGGAGGGTGGGGVQAITAQAPLVVTGTAVNPVLRLPNATITDAGAMSAADKIKLDAINPQASAQVQADWGETSNAAISFIRRKPGLASASTDGLMARADKAKLDALSPTLQPQVQADWSENDPNALAYVHNRPGPATASALGFVRPDGTTLSVDAAGMLSLTNSPLHLRGPADIAQPPPPPAAAQNDAFRATAAGVCDAAWAGLAGVEVLRNALLIFDGALWHTADVASGSLADLSVQSPGPLRLTSTAGGVELGVEAASASASGVVRLATTAEATGGVLNDVAVTPKQLSDAVGVATGGGITSLSGGAGISVTGTGSARTIASAFTGSNGVTVSGDVISGAYTGSNGVTVSGGTISGSYRAGSSGLLTIAADVIDVAASDANTASQIVARDASGNFAAGVITATLAGQADSALSAATAATADRLATPVRINGQLFDGSADINVATASMSALSAGSYLSGGSFDGSAAVTFAVQATSANTASQIVARDASGNFEAGVITAALSGKASTAALADRAYTADNATNAATATSAGKLTTPVTINGVSFDGSAPITLPASTVATLTPSGYLTGSPFDGASAQTWGVHAAENAAINTLAARSNTGTLTATGFIGPLSGNADTATKLAAPVNINGVPFDGSAPVNLPPSAGAAHSASGYLTGAAYDGSATQTWSVNASEAATPSTLVARTSGNVVYAGTFSGALSGNADTATKLAAPVNINGVPFDGSAPVVFPPNASLTPGSYLVGSAYNGTGAQTWRVHADTASTADTIVARTTDKKIFADWFVGDLWGEARYASMFTTARQINGVLFDGSKDITIPPSQGAAHSPSGYLVGGHYNGTTAQTWSVNASEAATPGTLVARTSGNVVHAGTFSGTLAGNAATATKLAAPVAINGVAFDGSAAINLPAATQASTGVVQIATTMDVTLGAAGKAVDAAQLKATAASLQAMIPSTAGLVQKAGDTMTGGLTIANGSDINVNGGMYLASVAPDKTFLYAETPSAAGWCHLKFSASNNVFFETSSSKVLTVGGGQVNLKAGPAQYDHGSNGATFNRRLNLNNDGSNYAHLFLDSWASINATDWRADYNARKELWLWGGREDGWGYTLIAGGHAGGSPVRFAITENQGASPTTRQIAHIDDGGNWHNASDRRLKKNIKAVHYGLDTVLAMKPVSFTYKADGKETIGFVAQDLHKVVPEAVGKPESEEGVEGDWSVAPSLLTPVLVKAIQELEARVSTLEAKS